MDLSLLYELRERLAAAAIAGTALLADDFRLKRAAEQFAPLQSAAPVFARIGGLCQKLLAPDCDNRAGALLDTLALVDAVLCTQGAVAVDGPVEPLEVSGWGSTVTNAPYSVITPLVGALQNAGGGRYSFVMDTHDTRPELFEDYRVKAALVKALGASYAELADNAKQWLSEDGEGILPLLTRGFDPNGKREMVRRVQVIEAVAGAKANAFYLSQLENAAKDVRAALIYALRHDETNAGLLLHLAQTEKGVCKKQAHWALSRLESPLAWDYWRALADKKPAQAAEYMALSTTQRASELVGEALLRLIEPYEQNPQDALAEETAKWLQSLLFALPGKHGSVICDFYRRAAALGSALDRCAEGEDHTRLFHAGASQPANAARPFSLALPILLRRALVLNPTPDLLGLAGTLYQAHGDRFAAPALTAALLSRQTGAAYALAQPLFVRQGLFRRENSSQKAVRGALLETLDMIRWDGRASRQALTMYFYDPVEERGNEVWRPLLEPLDFQWYTLLTDPKISHKGGCDVDNILIRLIRPGDKAVCELVGSYLYNRALQVQDAPRYFPALRLCGWDKCEDLAVRFCLRQKNGGISGWSLKNFLSQMPGSGGDRAGEAERVLRLVEDGKVHLRSCTADDLRQWAADLRAEC